MTETNSPRCPNHRVPLIDCSKGVGKCPISGCDFTYDEDEYEKTRKLKLTAMGTMVETGDWKVKQINGDKG